MDKKLCAMCNKMFTPKRKDQTYCGVECRCEFNRNKHMSNKVKTPPMSKSQAQANAYLMDRPLQSIDDLIEEVFERKITND